MPLHTMLTRGQHAAFSNPSSSTLGLITASMSIGSLIAIPFVPYTADILGRRTGVVIGCSIMICGVALICIGFHVALFIVGRLILGFGIAIAHVSPPAAPTTCPVVLIFARSTACSQCPGIRASLDRRACSPAAPSYLLYHLQHSVVSW